VPNLALGSWRRHREALAAQLGFDDVDGARFIVLTDQYSDIVTSSGSPAHAPAAPTASASYKTLGLRNLACARLRTQLDLAASGVTRAQSVYLDPDADLGR
jgi:hypothetical protein